jgi:hypothetical protein
MYKTGQPIRYDAQEHLLWLAELNVFQMVPGRLAITVGEPLPPLAMYGWHHVPGDMPNRDRLVDRPLGTLRKNVAGVLPPSMRSLAEVLCLVSSAQLVNFCGRLDIRGSRPLTDGAQVERLQLAVRRRLDPDQRSSESERKDLRRLLKRINPLECRPPVGYLDPALRPGEPVAFSASALHYGGSVYGVPSAPGHPVIAQLGTAGIELYGPPAPISYRISAGAVDCSGPSDD